MTMDYIRAFDVELDRPVFYAGEMLTGHVYVEVEENMRLQNIKVFLRGKAHAEWKITRAGERRTMKQDEHYLDERMMIWGKEENDSHQGIPILSRGRHRYPFHFQLPETVLPCSFESKVGNIRYYVRVNLNIPYASCPQCIRYFTIIGPHIDCVDERFLTPVSAVAKRNSCSLCCGKGPLLLRATLERTSYVCGEQIVLKADVQNGSDSEVWVLCKVIQYVEFFINKGVLGLSKEVRHTVFEAESEKVPPHDSSRLDELMPKLVLPIMPPTMVEVCGLVQIYYTLKLYLETSKGKGDAAEISLPITIATVPFRAPNGPMPEIHYEMAAMNVEGGMYISPEFQLGQVYMGDEVDSETDQTILYRPVYVCVSGDNSSHSRTDAHLLQVPPRQVSRSRENIRGSREGLNVQEAMSSAHVQQQMKMFQVHSDEGGSTSGCKLKKNIVEDKFLKEITAKIANRQLQDQNGEDGSKDGTGSGQGSSQLSTIEAHVELMRKQKKSNDNVHKALVNELRKHLSEGDEGVEIEKVPRGLKKPVGTKKVADVAGVSDTSKRIKTEMGKDYLHENEPSTSQAHDVGINLKTDSPRRAQIVPTVQTFTKIYPKTEILPPEGDEAEVEYTEHSALLTGTTNNIQTDNDRTSARKESSTASARDRSLDYEVSMQQSNEDLPFGDLPSPLEPPEEEDFELDEVNRLSGETERSDIFLELHDAPDVHSMRVFRSSAERTVNTFIPAALAATVTAAAPAAAELSPAKKTPTVAPKPKHKDRHSYPAAHPLSESTEESSGLTVSVSGRPKSEMMEHLRQVHSGDDSIA